MLALRSDASRALSTYALFYLLLHLSFLFFFFFNDTATTEIYTLSLHDALPILFGGANLVLRGPDGLIVTPLPIHQSLALVFAVPDFTVETKRARAALPATLPHADAVRAAAKSAALVHGLAHADARLLAAGLDDVLHVPFRRALVPGYDEVTGAARQAGAYGATLSGSGPTIVAVVGADGVRAVGDAMVRVWGARGTTAQTVHAARPARGFEAD